MYAIRSYYVSSGRQDILAKIRFISHWTNSSFHVGSIERPDSVHNCFNDANACAYIKLMALNGHIKFYECGAIGQYGVVEGAPKGHGYYNLFKGSALGKIFSEGKFVKHLNAVDDSDCASYWVLLGDWGVSLIDIAGNGTNRPEVEKENEKAFFMNAPLMRNELLRRAKAATPEIQ